MKPSDTADTIADLATRLAVALPSRLAEMNDSLRGQPRAASYDSEPPSPSLWCWNHERDVAPLVGVCEDVEGGCLIEALIVHDTVGEAAVNQHRARRDLAELDKQLVAALRAVNRCTDIVSHYAPAPEVTPAERLGIGKCDDCPKECDGIKGNRLRPWKQTGHRFCPGCWARWHRDEAKPA